MPWGNTMGQNRGLWNTMDERCTACLEAIPWNKTMGCQLARMKEGGLSFKLFYNDWERVASPFNAFMTHTSEFRPYSPEIRIMTCVSSEPGMQDGLLGFSLIIVCSSRYSYNTFILGCIILNCILISSLIPLMKHPL